MSYFSGQRTLSDLMFYDNMTSEVTAEVGSYYFNLGDNCAQWWGCRIEDFVIDVPIEFRYNTNNTSIRFLQQSRMSLLTYLLVDQ